MMPSNSIPRSLARRSPRRRSRSGVAIFMGLATLMLLLAVSVPYVLGTQHQHAAAVAHSERIRARLGARSAADHGLAMMSVMARGNQYAGWTELQDNPPSTGRPPYQGYNDPFVDSLDEFHVNLPRDLAGDFPSLSDPAVMGSTLGRSGFMANDDRSQIWSTRVEDEQGKVDLNTATPALIGNVLGSGIIERVDGRSGGMTIIMREGGEHFRDMPGYFVVGGVLVSYDRKDSPTGNIFTGCRAPATHEPRVFAGDVNPPPVFVEDPALADGAIRRRGALAVPVAAWLIPYYRMLKATDPSRPGRFDSVDQMRLVANIRVLPNNPFAGTVPAPRWLATRELFSVHTFGPGGGGFHMPQIAEFVDGWTGRDQQEGQAIAIFSGDIPNPEWLVASDPRRQRRGLPPGVNLRLRYPDGASGRYVQALSLANRGRGEAWVTSLEPLPNAPALSDQRPIVEVIDVSPININTAPWEVLVANMKGLGRGENTIGVGEAGLVADAIRHIVRNRGTGFTGVTDVRYRLLHGELEAPVFDDLEAGKLMWGRLRSDTDLDRLLELLVDGRVIEDWVRSAIMTHQQTVGSPANVSLAKWTYGSHGAVRIDGVATTYVPIGVQTARAHFREYAHIGSDQPFVWDWRDQFMLEGEQSRGQGNILASFVNGSRGRRTFAHMTLPVLLDPDATFAQGTREVAIGPGTTYSPAIGRDFFREPFQFTDGRGLSLSGVRTSGGSLSFWHQWPEGARLEGQDSYIFDVAERPGTNQMSLLWWGFGPFAGRLASQPPGLCFRVADRTIERAFTVVRVRPNAQQYEPGNWYHYWLGWQGVDPSNVAMLVDGRARFGNRGSSSMAAMEVDQIVQQWDGRWVSRNSNLRGDVSPSLGISLGNTDVIEVDDTSIAGFWPPEGVIRIGEEAIEYSVLTTRGFGGLRRGARGTVVPDSNFPDGGVYRTGQRVSLWGYSTHVVHHDSAPSLPRGGSNLLSTLEGNGIYPVGVGNADPNPAYFAGDLIGPSAGASKATGIIPIPLDAGVPEYGIWYIRGPAWTDYSPSPVDPSILIPNGSTHTSIGGGETLLNVSPLVEAEYVLAQRVSEGLRVLRRWNENFVEKTDPNTHLQFMGGPVHYRDNAGTSQRIPSKQIDAWFWAMSGSVCVLVSVAPTPGGEYLDPMTFTDPNGMLVPAATARVQVGVGGHPTFFEWIKYSRLVEAPNTVLLAYTIPGAASTAAFMAAMEVNRSTASDPSSSKIAIAGITINEHREINPRSVDPNVSPSFTHAGGANVPVTPVFAIKGWAAGPNDPATILQSPNNFAAGGIIRRTGDANLTIIEPGNIGERTQLVAFDRHHGRAFPADPTSEVLKFPSRSDALPVGNPAALTLGHSRHPTAMGRAGGGGRMDELRAEGFGSLKVWLGDPVNSAANRVIVSTNGSLLPAEMGVIKINDEYIAYRQMRSARRRELLYEPQTTLPRLDPDNSGTLMWRENDYVELTGLTRGCFGSRPADHARWDGVHLVRGITVASIQGQLSPQENRIPIILPRYGSQTIPFVFNTPLLNGGRQPAMSPFGFGLIDPGGNADSADCEVFGYNRFAQQPDATLLFAGDYRESNQAALFRGAYGSRAKAWTGTGTLQPILMQFHVREPDYFPAWMANNPRGPGTVSTEIAHAQGGDTFPNSTLGTLRWFMDDGGNPRLRQMMGARLYLRFDGAPGWDAAPIDGPPRRTAGSGRSTAPPPTGPFLYAFEFEWSGRADTDMGEAAMSRQIDLSRLGVGEVSRIEWRLCLYWKDGAWAEGEWKGSLRFRGLTLGLQNETRVLSHEELR